MNATMQTITKFALTDIPDIPEPVLQFAAELLVDTIGVAAGSVPIDAGRIARDFAAISMGAPADIAVPLPFDGRPVSAMGLGYATGSQIDNLDAHDGFNLVKGHIGCAIVPALIAWGAKQPNLTGRDALTAMVIGYEIAARAGISLHGSVSDYHTSGAWNGIGVAALGARLNKLSPDQLRHAFGIAEYHGPRSQMMREIATPTMLHDGSGMGAMTGIMAVELAANKFTGAPAITLEAPEAEAIWSDLGSVWTLLSNYIKPYPTCRWSHQAIDALRGLQLTHHFTPEQIESIHVRVFHAGACLFDGMPDTTSMAQYSLPFAVATMARFGQIGAQHISGTALHDPQTAKMLSRITVTEGEEYTTDFPALRQADVTVTLKDDQVLSSGPVQARGDPETRMSQSELREKFDHLTSVSLTPKRSSAIWDRTISLTEPDSRFADLLQHILPKADHDA